MRPSTSFKASGVMRGYLGWREPPACILERTDSGRVSSLFGQSLVSSEERENRCMAASSSIAEALMTGALWLEVLPHYGAQAPAAHPPVDSLQQQDPSPSAPATKTLAPFSSPAHRSPVVPACPFFI